jgi:5-hydroxyisourate hydrolase-like protein (transthyretin family)
VQGNGTGNPFTFNFSVTGTYVVTITPKCGSQDCQPCKFVIEINKSSNKTAGNVNNYGINDEGIKKEVSSVQDGEPTPGIEVYVEQEPNKEPIANVVTDENGEIEIVVSRNSELPASGFFSFTIIPSKAFISKSKLPASFKEIIMVPYTRNITGKYRFVLKWIANPEMQKSNKGSFAVSGRNST